MCTECGQTFLTIGTLKKHLQNQHFNPQTFQCHLCQKVFKRKVKLNDFDNFRFKYIDVLKDRSVDLFNAIS